jgi:hypothetical protein
MRRAIVSCQGQRETDAPKAPQRLTRRSFFLIPAPSSRDVNGADVGQWGQKRQRPTCRSVDRLGSMQRAPDNLFGFQMKFGFNGHDCRHLPM